MMKNLLVDVAYSSKAYPRNIIVEVDGEYYLIPTLGRESNDLASFKKISNNVIAEKNLEELPNYRYATLELEKRIGHNIEVGRPISDKELEDLKKTLKLSDDDISEPFENVKGSIYGEKSEKKFRCIQVKVDEMSTIKIEKNLRKKGIEAGSDSSGRVNIRISEWTLNGFRKFTGKSQSEFAFHFGLSVRNLQEWEQGKKAEPPYLLDLLERIWKLEMK